MSHVSLRTFAAEFFNWQKHQAKQTHPKCSDDMTIASLHRHWQYQWRQSWFTGSCYTFQLGHFFNWDIYSWMRKKQIIIFLLKEEVLSRLFPRDRRPLRNLFSSADVGDSGRLK